MWSHLLVTFVFQSLVYAYDQSVQRDTVLSKSFDDKDERQYLYERASQYGDENIKIVRLQKTADPLVCSIVHLFVTCKFFIFLFSMMCYYVG